MAEEKDLINDNEEKVTPATDEEIEEIKENFII